MEGNMEICLPELFHSLDSVIPLLVGSALTLFIQTTLMNKNRKIQNEEKQADSRRKVTLDRLEKLEIFLYEDFVTNAELMDQISHFANHQIGSQEISRTISLAQNKLLYIQAMAIIFNNNSFNIAFESYNKNFVDFINSLFAVLNHGNTNNHQILMNEIGANYGKMQEPFIELIGCIDKMKNIALTDSKK
jgi:hypothetical protein